MIFFPVFKKIAGTCIFYFLVMVICLASTTGLAQEHTDTRPIRIVSLSPVITESLYLLGLKDNIAGVTIYCNRPADAKTRPVIGTVMEPDIEKIVKLRPDLVLAMGLTNQKVLVKMKSLGLNVMTWEIPGTFSGICDVFLKIGAATGKTTEARRIVETARVEVDNIRKKTRDLKKPKVIMELGAKPFFVATKDFFVNDYLEFAGAVNIFRDTPSGAVSREEAIIRNPDVIFVVTMGLSGKNEWNIWNRYSSVSAVKHGRVHVMASDDVCSPTPLTFVKSLKNIAVLLHPELDGVLR